MVEGMSTPLLVRSGYGADGGGSDAQQHAPPRTCGGRVRAAVDRTPRGELALLAFLLVLIVVYGAVTSAAVASAYAHPEVRLSTREEESVEMPYVVTCPTWTDGSAGRITAQRLVYDPERRTRTLVAVEPVGSILVDPEENSTCTVFGFEGLRFGRSAIGLSVGSSPVLFRVEPRSLAVVVIALRYTPPESVATVPVRGEPGVAYLQLAPSDPGENGATINVVNGTFFNVEVTRTDTIGVDGSIERSKVGIRATQQFNLEAPTVDAFQVAFPDLETAVRQKYVRLTWLYLLGAVGGAVSVAKFTLFLYRQACGPRTKSV